MANYADVPKLLQSAGVKFKVLDAKPSLEEGQVETRSIILKDDVGSVMAIFSGERFFELSSICNQLQRELEPTVGSLDTNPFELDGDLYIPPYPNQYNAQVIIDSNMPIDGDLCIQVNEEERYIQIDAANFIVLLGKDVRFFDFTIPLGEVATQPVPTQPGDNLQEVAASFATRRLKQRVLETQSLPVMPGITKDLLKLSVRTDASAMDLAQVVEKDPSLAAQVVMWSQSPYYGYAGRIDGIEDAIIKVLGYDLVMNLALGLGIGQSIKVFHNGPLGLKAYWRTALLMAILMQEMVPLLPKGTDTRPGLAYLAGLLHNFGFLLLGHLFAKPYKMLNQTVLLNPDVSIASLQYHTFGVSHNQMAYDLFQDWKLPDEVLVAIKYGHQVETPYRGEHHYYANLISIVGILLRQRRIGYFPDISYNKKILNIIEIPAYKLIKTLDKTIELQGETVDFMCKSML